MLAAARAFSDLPFFRDATGELPFRDLAAAVSAVAASLRHAGVRAGMRVGLPGHTDPLVPLAAFALARLGALAVVLNPRLPTALVGTLCETAGVTLVIGPDAACSASLPWGKGLKALPRGPADRWEPEPDSPLVALHTSGSTSGMPRAMVLTWSNFLASARGAATAIPFGPGHAWLLSLPLFHVGGFALVMRALHGGGTILFPDAPLDAAVDRWRPSHLSVVPTQLWRLLEREGALLESLRAVLVGGGPCSPALLDDAAARGVPAFLTYGLTETASQVATARWPAEGLAVLPEREVKIEDGAIAIRGGVVTRGCLGPSGVEPLADEAGWLRTRDRGELLAEGRLRVLGRLDRMFIVGGENVQPEAVEQALCRVPGVLEALVVAYPDAEYGSRPVAFVRTADGVAPSRESLREVLPGFAIPVAFFPFPAIEGLKPSLAHMASLAAQLMHLKSQ